MTATPYDCPKHGSTFWCPCIAANPSLVPDSIAEGLLANTAAQRDPAFDEESERIECERYMTDEHIRAYAARMCGPIDSVPPWVAAGGPKAYVQWIAENLECSKCGAWHTRATGAQKSDKQPALDAVLVLARQRHDADDLFDLLTQIEVLLAPEEFEGQRELKRAVGNWSAPMPLFDEPGQYRIREILTQQPDHNLRRSRDYQKRHRVKAGSEVGWSEWVSYEPDSPKAEQETPGGLGLSVMQAAQVLKVVLFKVRGEMKGHLQLDNDTTAAVLEAVVAGVALCQAAAHHRSRKPKDGASDSDKTPVVVD